MKVKVIVEFSYEGQMVKDIDKFAREQNMPIEEIAKVSMKNLLDDCYACSDGESYTVRAEYSED